MKRNVVSDWGRVGTALFTNAEGVEQQRVCIQPPLGAGLLSSIDKHSFLCR
ncbi:hypothetical protein [Viscerimonas tarda]